MNKSLRQQDKETHQIVTTFIITFNFVECLRNKFTYINSSLKKSFSLQPLFFPFK